MKKKRMGWERWATGLLMATVFGCGSGDLVYHSPDDTGNGGAGGSDGGGGGTSSGDGAACAGQCVPLGPTEWSGPTLLWMSKNGEEPPECPSSASVKGSLVFADLNAPNGCGDCTCEAPSGSCALATTVTAAASPCAGNEPGVPHTSFDAPAGWNGACTDENPISVNQKCNGAACVQSLTIAPLTLTEAPCAASTTPVASKLPYLWGAAARTCRGAAVGSCATDIEVCTPPAPSGFEQCLLQKGENECPSTYPIRHVFYKDFTDTRSCTPCACSAPVGSTCTAFISAFKDSGCSSPIVAGTVDATGSACFDILPSGQALGSKLATEPVYAPGLCQVSGGEAIGEAVPEEPSTFCCLPP